MFFRILELGFIGILAILIFTQVILPIFTNERFFDLFRKSKPKEIPVVEKPAEGSLDDKLEKAKEKVVEVKQVQSEVAEHFKSAQQQKEESDNLLK